MFGNQLWDNVLFALGSGVTVWTAYESFFMWAYANSVASLISLEEHPVLFVALILLIPYWAGFHFYVQHRIMHWPPLYRLVHYRHHRNINLAPWSGMSLHPAEHVVDQSDCLLFLFIPSHPVHVIFNLMFRTVGAISSHTGYDGLRLTRSRRFEFGDFFHHLHHRYFDCNYGSLDTPWDRRVWQLSRRHAGKPPADQGKTPGDAGPERPGARALRPSRTRASAVRPRSAPAALLYRSAIATGAPWRRRCRRIRVRSRRLGKPALRKAPPDSRRRGGLPSSTASRFSTASSRMADGSPRWRCRCAGG